MADAVKKDADVIVVGAGALGNSAAWHLRRQGKTVLMVEATDGPARQTTQAAAGFVVYHSGVHKLSWGRELGQVQNYGIDFYTDLNERCGRDIGYGRVGCAYIFLTDVWDDWQEGIQRTRDYGQEAEILTEERAAEVTPFIEYEAVRGIVYVPGGVRVRAGDAHVALSRELQNDGVVVRWNTRVTGFVREGDRVGGVITSAGEFRADDVVVAAGAWSYQLLKTIGVNCPAEPAVETRFVTPPLEGVSADMPMLIFRDWQRFYVREERGGLLLGGGDHAPDEEDRNVDVDNPPRTEDIPDDQAYRIRGLLTQVEHVMPMLKDVEIGEIRSGMPTFTEDDLFIMGPAPGIKSLYVMAGCQESGVTHGPGFGRLIAELISGQKPFIDPAPYSPGRFEKQ
jgi:glycine/D-amino acid oxidase-like deaminating enzyme